MSKKVREQSAQVIEMSKHWPRIGALLGGTTKMRETPTLLPKWPNEDKESYESRLAVATLFPAFGRTIEVLAGRPFSKPVTIGEDVPSRLKEWCEDVDLQGRNLHAFLGAVCEQALAYGLSGILVDVPAIPKDTFENGVDPVAPRALTIAEERAMGIRPYFVQIHPQNILGWRSTRKGGQDVLTQLRLLENVTVEDGEFGEKTIEQVRVLRPGSWEVWQEVESANSKEKNWQKVDEGATSLGKIPFVPVYGKRLGYMRSMPPLLELAHMNVEHWQSKSDQQTLLHVARVPILAVIGVDDKNWKLTVGASAAVKLPHQADMKYVEHTGKAIESGRISLLDLEDGMRQAGAELLVIKPGNTTEVQTLADNEQGMCALQRITSDLEDCADQALQFMAEFVKETKGGHVTIFKDFGAATLAEASAELLLKMAQAGKLSDETLFNETKRRGIVSPDADWDEEKDRIDEQGPGLGMAGLDPATGLPLPPAGAAPTPPGQPPKPGQPPAPAAPAQPPRAE